MSEVKREHLAGLKLALAESDIGNTESISVGELQSLIAQASAAPEQEVASKDAENSAHDLALKVREALDRTSCPDAWMRIAYESVVREYTHADPSEVERLRAELEAESKGADRAAEAMLHWKKEADSIREQLAMAQALLRGLTEYADELLAEVNIAWSYAGSTGENQTHKDASYSNAVAFLSATAQSAECCKPTEAELKLIADGEYRAEELWGGSRPTCPKCIGKATEGQTNE